MNRNSYRLCGKLVITMALYMLSGIATKSQPYNYYKPLALVNPAHFDAKEYSLALGYDGGVDFNLSYSITKNVALFAGGNANAFAYPKKASVNYTIHNSNFTGLAGLGYFKHRQYNFFNIVELFAGGRISTVDNFVRKENSTSDSFDDFTQAQYFTLFGQLQTNAMKKKYGLLFASRISYNTYSLLEFYRRSRSQVSEATSPFGLLALEPAFGLTLPVKNIRFNLQLGVSLPVYSEETKITETFVASGATNDYTENYGDFYFFWRLNFSFLKTKWKLR